jgi:Ca-activated chloride channel homolog
VVIGGWAGLRLMDDSSCRKTAPLSLTAAPEIAPAVQEATKQWSGGGLNVQGRCFAVNVVPAPPADVAAAIGGGRGLELNGIGRADGRTRVPEIWVPDSRIWLERLRAVGPDTVPAEAPSVARSPVVLAVPEPVTASLAGSSPNLPWPAVLQRMVTDTRIHAGIVNPDRDAAGMSALLAVTAAAGTLGPDAQEIAVGAMRAFDEGQAELPSALLLRFPRDSKARTIAASLALAPMSEQSVLSYNTTRPPVPLVALRPEPAPNALDYPYTVLPGLSRDRAEAAAAVLRSALSGDKFRDLLARQGLRAADGTAGAGFLGGGTPPALPPQPAPPPEPAAINEALSTWLEITRPARMLAVVDVSGSMLTPVPTAGGLSREQVAVAAAKGGLGLFDDSWAVGLWIFSTKLDGNKDYRELVPLGPLTAQRDRLGTALGGIKAVRGGGTGLHDTILAAYKNVQAGWDPGRGNSVVVITDGKDEDPGGLSQAQLIAELKRVADPKRPIQVILIGIGAEVTEPVLRPISDVTGGASYVARDPSKIGEIFLKALALRSG